MDIKYEVEFNPGYKGKLFDVKPITITCIVQPEVDPKSDAGKYIQDLVIADWKKQLDALKKEKEKLYLDAINATEKAIYANFSKEITQKDPKTNQYKYNTTASVNAWLDAKAKDPNFVMSLNNAMATMKDLMEKKAQEIYDKSAEAVDKKFKTTISRAKKKAAAKVAAYVGVVLVSGALTVLAAGAGFALTVVTFGAGAVAFVAVLPLAATTITAAATSIKSIYDIVSKDMPNMKKERENLIKAIVEFRAAIQYDHDKQVKKETKKLGKYEKLKLKLNDISGKRKTVLKHVGLLNAFLNRMRQKMEEAAVQVDLAYKKIHEIKEGAELYDKKGEKDIAQCESTILKCNEKIREGVRYLNSVEESLRPFATDLADLDREKTDEQMNQLEESMVKAVNFLENDTTQDVVVHVAQAAQATASATLFISKIISSLSV